MILPPTPTDRAMAQEALDLCSEIVQLMDKAQDENFKDYDFWLDFLEVNPTLADIKWKLERLLKESK
jgi:hypothetical protein